MALLCGDGRGRLTTLSCLVLVAARLEQETQAVGVALLRGHESGRLSIPACFVLVTSHPQEQGAQ